MRPFLASVKRRFFHTSEVDYPELSAYKGVFGSDQSKDYQQIWGAIQTLSREAELYYSACDPKQAMEDFRTKVNVLEVSVPTGLNNPRTQVRCSTSEDTFYSANFVTSLFETKENGEKRVDIACQAPNILQDDQRLNTLSNFFRIVWEQHVTLIVNLVKTDEKASKYDYIPKLLENPQIDDLQIQATKTKEIAQNAIVYALTLKKSNQERTVALLHLNDWEDHDLPTIHVMQTLIGAIQKYQDPNLPKLIHCHAGVYRTGLVFTLLNIAAFLKKHPSQELNVPELIIKLRKSRFRMIRDEKRLEIIDEFIKAINTSEKKEQKS